MLPNDEVRECVTDHKQINNCMTYHILKRKRVTRYWREREERERFHMKYSDWVESFWKGREHNSAGRYEYESGK